jgi:hypothetical protein
MQVSLRASETHTLDSVTPEPSATSVSSAEPAGPTFDQVLHGLGREISGGEVAMRTAVRDMRGGGDLGPERLIALQAGVYRYSEAIDLTSHLVDRATSGIKTVLQSGGQ